MKITVMTPDENFITLDVDPEESVENVKALLEVETGAAIRQQQLRFNGREMGNSERLSKIGVREGDLITMSTAGSSQMLNNQLRLNPDGSAANPGAFQQHLRDNPEIMAQLFQTDPALAQAVIGENLEDLQKLLQERHNQKMELRRKQEQELALMYADPFDAESQRKIEEMIRQKGIDENMETAIEHNPEAFARVVMLYVDMEVNGVPIKAFIDSGAQSTIISRDCAEQCGLLRLLDKRFRGVAVGVGQSEIIGRIHMAPIKIGNAFYPCSFTVLDAPNMEFLFGLDMLRKHQCIIDLKENVLRVGAGEVSVPFLQEKDIPSHIGDEARLSTQASLGQGSNPASHGIRGASPMPPDANTSGSGPSQNVPSPDADFETKITKLVELGFPREAAMQALKLFNGNEEQAAGFLFGG